MVARRDLNAPPGRRLADIVRSLRDEAKSGHTGAPGVVDLGERGDVVWTGTDPNGQPVEHSVKRFQVDLDDTTERAAQLEADLAQAEQDITAAQGRLDTAEQELGALDTRVDTAEGDISLAAQAAEAADARAVAAQQAAADAQEAAEQAAIDAAGKARVVYSATAPAPADDVLWFDTANGNIPKVWDAPLGDTARRNELVNPFGPTLTSSSGWAAIRGDVSVVTDEGRPAVRVLANATGGTYIDPTARISPPVGTQVRFSVEVKVTADTTGMRLSTASYSGAATSGNTMPYTTQTVADGWVRYDLTVTVTAMPSGAYLRTLVWPHGTAFAVGQGFLLRNAIVEYDTTGVWFDGSTAGARWAGTANASASIYDGPAWRELRDAGVQQALDAAAAAMAEARYAPRIANRAPTAADGTSKPTGAGWLQYDSAGRLIQMWRWSGTAWERLDMAPVMIPVIQIGTGTAGDLSADRVTVTSQFVAQVAQILQLDVANLIVTEGATINELVAQAFAAATADIQQAYIQNLRTNGATIDEAVIDDLAANLITSGLFRTAETGQRLEIDSNGLVMYGVNADGVEYEMVRLGPSGSNLMTIGQTTVAPESIATPEVNAGALNVAGRSFADHLADRPLGVQAWMLRTSNTNLRTSKTRVIETTATLQPNRMYLVEVSPLAVYTSGGTGLVEEALEFYKLPFTSWSNVSQLIYTNIRTTVAGQGFTLAPLSAIVVTGSADGGDYGFLVRTWSGPLHSVTASSSQRITLTVTDIGPNIAKTGVAWMDPSESGGGGTPSDPTTPVQRFVKTYTSTGYRCYNLDGSDAGRPDVVHGLYSGGPSNSRRRGGWLFPSMTGDLSGATVEKVEMYISCTQTHYSTGSTVNPAVWGSTMANNLTAFTSVYGWKAGTSKWITLPSSLYAGFKSGQYAGVGVIPTSGDPIQYARFAPTGAQIRITYTK